MLHGVGFSRRPYAEPGGRVCPFILAEVERDQRSRVVLRRSWAELDGGFERRTLGWTVEQGVWPQNVGLSQG